MKLSLPEKKVFSKLNPQALPCHVAIIMDGNGRWAKQRGLTRLSGHRAGIKTVKAILAFARYIGIRHLTLYTFSTENWARPEHEIRGLFRLLDLALLQELPRLMKNNIAFRVCGNISPLPRYLYRKLNRAVTLTGRNTGMTVNLALNYGGRDELVRAFNKALQSRSTRRKGAPVSEDDIARHLYTYPQPDPDILIRTSGEIRISNFLLWQVAYTELFFIKKLWPDFSRLDFLNIIKDYQKRTRRFGAVAL